MARRVTNLDHLRRLCLALPEAQEIETWGEPTMRVRAKIFCFPGQSGFTVKADREELEALLGDGRFRPAPYLARGGWVAMTFPPDVTVDWDEIDELIRTSYCLIAPKKLSALIAPQA